MGCRDLGVLVLLQQDTWKTRFSCQHIFSHTWDHTPGNHTPLTSYKGPQKFVLHHALGGGPIQPRYVRCQFKQIRAMQNTNEPIIRPQSAPDPSNAPIRMLVSASTCTQTLTPTYLHESPRVFRKHRIGGDQRGPIDSLAHDCTWWNCQPTDRPRAPFFFKFLGNDWNSEGEPKNWPDKKACLLSCAIGSVCAVFFLPLACWVWGLV